MYQLKEETFGVYNKLTLFNESTGNGFSLVPEIGGTILELWLNGQQIIDACKNPKELENNQSYKCSFLFPFPNRLKDGSYELNGQAYQFEINEQGTSNALHGLGRDVEMDVLQTETGDSKASISLSYFNEGDQKSYPFPFLFDIVFEMSDKTGFSIKMKFTNEANENIPVGIGWHPYFNLGTKIDEVSLQLPDSKMISIDDRMIPDGNLLDYDYFKILRPINKAILDNGFKLKTSGDKAEVLLSNKKIKLKYWQETGAGKFNFLQVYTPPGRESIAVEPMTCNIDAFNNGDGLVLLKPEDFIEASCGVSKLRG